VKKLYREQIENNPNFCIMPFAHNHVTTEGEVALCCLAAYNYGLGSRPNVRDEKDLQKHWNGDFYKKIRQDMLDGKRVPECRTCWRQDDQGPGSDRETANNMVYRHWAVDGTIDENWDINIETGNSYNQPMWTDIRPGHTCNYKCRMCAPGVSDSLDKEQAQHPEVYLKAGAYAPGVLEPKNFTGLTFKEMSTWVEQEETMNSLKKWISNEHHITMKLVGGEPLATPGCVKLIQWCAESGNTDFNLCITTNGSIAKGKILSLLNQFPNVRIDFSGDSNLILDPKVNEYQRKNASSTVMHENFLGFKKIEGCTVNYLCATGIYNIFNIVNVLKYWKEYGMRQENGPIGKLIINLIAWPQEFDIEILPEEHRLKIAQEIEDFLLEPEFVRLCNEVYDNHKFFSQSTRLDLLINRLRNPTMSDEEILRLRKQCAKRTIAFDKIREESFRDALHPTIVKLIDEWNTMNE